MSDCRHAGGANPKESFDKWYYTVCNSGDSKVELAKKAFDRGRRFEQKNGRHRDG